MKKIFLILVFSIIFIQNLESQERRYFTYYDMSLYQQATPGAFRFGLNGFDNPAVLAINGGHFETSLFVNSPNMKISDFSNIGYFVQAGTMGYGLIRKQIDGKSVTNHRLSLGMGSKNFAIGLGWGFYSGAKDYFDYENTLNFGFIYRPAYYLSLAYSGIWAIKASQFEHTAELGIRPIKNYPLTFYGDATMFESDRFGDIKWGGGASWEFVDGMRVNGRYFSDKTFRLGFDVNIGGLAVSTNTKTSETNSTTYGIRFCPNDRTLTDDYEFMTNQYIKMELKGNYTFINNSSSFISVTNSKTQGLLNLFAKLDLIIKNTTIKGLVLNLDKLSADYATK